MPVDSKHPAFLRWEEKWNKCRIVVDGEEAVKECAEKVLPRLSGQTTYDYNAYLDRANFFPGTRRTVRAMEGMVFRKPPTIEAPTAAAEEAMDSIAIDGSDITTLLKSISWEVFSMGRLGLLVDADSSGTNPYLASYEAEDILNWRCDMIGDQKELTLVVLQETFHDYSEDPYDPKEVPQLRVLELVASESGDRYRCSISVYQKRRNASSGKEEWLLTDGPTYPSIRGRNLDFIPFVILGSENVSPDVDCPPILDLANVNLSLFRSSADLEHGRHWTALPTPWAAGFQVKDGEKLHIGSTTAWVADDPSARAGYLEFTGQGLSALENAIKEKKEEMAVLGSRMLMAEKASAEAADTLRMRKASESSIINSVITTIELGVNKALRWWADWKGFSGDVRVELNRDFVDMHIEVDVLKALMEGVQTGTISWDTFFYNLKRSSLVPATREADEERELIMLGAPVLVPGSMEDEDEEEESEESEESEE